MVGGMFLYGCDHHSSSPRAYQLMHEAGANELVRCRHEDVGHFVKKHSKFIEHAAEIAGGVALLATGPESWGASAALFNE